MKTTCKDSAQIARVWYGRCLSLEALEGEHGWGWYFGQRPNLRKSAQCDKDQALHDTLAKFAKEDGFTLPREHSGEIGCAGWSDLYYVPRRAARAYYLMQYRLAHHGVFHEVSVPTGMNALSGGDFVPLAKAPQLKHKVEAAQLVEIVLGCVGNCCLFNLENTPSFVGYPCGHRLNMGNSVVRHAWQHALDSARPVSALLSAQQQAKLQAVRDRILKLDAKDLAGS
jgi:hypothetical protein